MNESDILIQNPWWSKKESIYDDEKITTVLSRKSQLPHIFPLENLLIIGPRQTGKTTFLKLFVKELLEKETSPRNILYFACDMLRKKEDIIDLMKTFDMLSSSGKKYVLLDEVTFVENWSHAVKFIFDSGLARNKVIYITGSSSVGLRKESFPGRNITTKHFLPASFKNFCAAFGSGELRKAIASHLKSTFSPKENFKIAKNFFPFIPELENLFGKYVECGGYPKAFFELMEDGRIKDETGNVYQQAVLFDITKQGRSERIAQSVIRGIIKNYGNKFSLNSIAKEMEIGSHVTVRDYLELLEELFAARNYFQIALHKKVPMLRKERKVFFIDPFIFNVFSKLFSISNPDKIPAVVEGIVGEHLQRNFRNVSFYHNNKEIDFILGNCGIEVKWQKKVDSKDFPRIDIQNKILLSRESIGFNKERNLAIVPAYIFLLQL